ncbi:MAG: S24 family peptidase [Synechococcaceae cyanobacterium]|nr:S24 family peptidase [Synechococcaceae cyanobacterium]
MSAVLPPGIPLPLRSDPVPPHPPAARQAAGVGFPSPADDFIEARIDLNVELIPSPLSTFLMRVSGDAMRGDGILDGDLLVIDRSIDARPGMVVVVTCDGAFLLRRLRRRGAALWLVASDGASPPIALRQGDGQEGGADLWGVAIHAVHHLAGAPSRRR